MPKTRRCGACSEKFYDPEDLMHHIRSGECPFAKDLKETIDKTTALKSDFAREEDILRQKK
jgi:hypothetical protein